MNEQNTWRIRLCNEVFGESLLEGDQDVVRLTTIENGHKFWKDDNSYLKYIQSKLKGDLTDRINKKTMSEKCNYVQEDGWFHAVRSVSYTHLTLPTN